MSWEARLAEWEQGKLGAMVLDESLQIVCVSQGVVDRSGTSLAEYVGRPAVNFVHPDDLPRAGDVLLEVQATAASQEPGLYRLRMASGAFEYFAISASSLGPEHAGSIKLEFMEPTALVRAKALADDAVDAMRMLSEDISLDQSLDWVARVGERHAADIQIVITLFGTDGRNQVFSRAPIPAAIQQVNETASRSALPIHVEKAVADFTNRRWRSSKRIASLDYIVPGRLTSVLADRKGEIVGYVEALRSTAEAPTDAEWTVHGVINRMMTAVLHRHEFDRHLRQAADMDALTGLINRRKLFEILGSHPNLAGSLLYLIDLDRFSWVNNNLGHQAGDETLLAVARALIQVCPPKACIARLGGDEFVVWVPSDQAVDDLADLGNRISKSMVVPAGIGDGRVWVRGSIGMVQVRHGESAADALNRADVAMYASKRGGGDSATLG